MKSNTGKSARVSTEISLSCTFAGVRFYISVRKSLTPADVLLKKMVTLKNLILKYIGRKKNQYIEKKVSCWNQCSVFRSDIETV
jgi:hypothetical protein